MPAIFITTVYKAFEKSHDGIGFVKQIYILITRACVECTLVLIQLRVEENVH